MGHDIVWILAVLKLICIVHIGNALKYTSKGIVAVRLLTDDGYSKSSKQHGSTYVALEVQDTGIGMSQDFLQTEIWQPFRQVNALSSGAGIGLSIVKEVAKDLGASVGVESELEKGTQCHDTVFGKLLSLRGNESSNA